jgi:hypothetical protein
MNVLFEWKLPASYTGSLAKSDVQFNQAVDITLMPNAHTFLTPDVLWMNVIADLLIALSFFTIPVGIYYLIRRRQDLKQAKFIFVLFISFIVLCGLTHLLEAITIWQPLYRTGGNPQRHDRHCLSSYCHHHLAPDTQDNKDPVKL